MVFTQAEMPDLHSGGGLRHLGVIQEAAQYLDQRSKRGVDPGHRYRAITGTHVRSSRPKRKAEDSLPQDPQLFADATPHLNGMYMLELKVPGKGSKVIKNLGINWQRP